MPKGPMQVGCAKAVQIGTYGNSTWANVFYFLLGDVSGHSVLDVLTSVARAVSDFYSVGIQLASLPNNWTSNYVTVEWRDTSETLQRAKIADAQAGTATDASQDAQVAYLVNYISPDPRKGGKPRTYVIGVRGANMADSAELTLGAQTAFNSRLATWLTSLLTTGTGRVITMELVEMSFRNAKAWRPEGVAIPIAGALMNPWVATQRRRVDRRRL